ncbi:LysE family transporter [Streptomyces xanthophaeus]|uniref:LysE family transporter n=1 Tax=Streptomyces xanthophaeus TaxID=67385 RepID=UPI0026488010|nr:LysE family transporter [Streptomyces xanthophaeus]WKD34784.1 LysE family transporter [Streptomyces xanthophaeus]
MSELMTPTLAGAAAGLGVAMPMGAMSVLLLQEAMRDRRTAVAAAAGIAAVDLGYAGLATVLGPWVASHISPVEAWVRLASAVILLVIAARGLAGARPTGGAPGSGAVPDRSLVAADAAASDSGHGSSAGSGSGSGAGRAGVFVPTRPGKAFVRYVGLTALNPTTALYFAALTTAQGAALRTGAAGGAFLLGVGAASLLWQQALVALGSLAGTRIPDRARVWTFRLGYGLVAAYAVKIALPLP